MHVCCDTVSGRNAALPGTTSTPNEWIYDASVVHTLARRGTPTKSAKERRARVATAFSPRCLSFSSPAYQPPADDVAIGDAIVAVNGTSVEGMNTQVCTTGGAAAGSYGTTSPCRCSRCCCVRVRLCVPVYV